MTNSSYSSRYLEYDSLEVRRNDTKKILSGITFSVASGEVVAILGPSGSGKTTLLRATAGFIRQATHNSWLARCFLESTEPYMTGELFLEGKDITALPPQSRNMAMVRQTWDLLPYQSVWATLMLPLSLRGVYGKEAENSVYKILHLLRLEDKRDRLPGQLSGGENQRLALGRALVRPDVKLYLFDECLSSLDESLRKELMQIIKTKLAERPVTSIWVTHLAEEAMFMANRVAVMDKGRLLQVGHYEELLKNPKSLDVFKIISGSPGESICLMQIRNGKFFRDDREVNLPNVPRYEGELFVGAQRGLWQIVESGGFEGVISNCSYVSASARIITVSIEGWVVQILSTDGDLRVGDKVLVRPMEKGVFYFSAHDGSRVHPQGD